MANKTFNDVQINVKWKPLLDQETTQRKDLESLSEADASGFHNDSLAQIMSYGLKYLIDLRGAAFTEIETDTTSTGTTYVSTNTKLPNVASVKAFVEGKGYVTSSGVTNVASGDGLTGGPISTTGTLKANLKDYTKSTVGVLALTNPTSNTKFYPVSLDKDGKLGVNVPWTYTDTKVTSAANHYAPSADSGSALSVDASSSTAATWGTTALVTGVNIERDAKGHVTGLTLDSIKMPSNPNTNTTYTFAEGTTNGAFSVTPSGGSAQSVPIHGLGSAAYTASTAYAAASHNHSASNITSGTLGVARGGTGATTFTSGQVLVGNGTSAVSTKAIDTTVTSGSTNLVTSGAVWTAIDNLPEPMVFKGTVGASGDSPTATSLPVDGTATVGDTYKVITDGTYGGQAAKIGDTLICNSKTSSANTWVLIPSGDDVEDTWRNIKVNGTEKLGTGISTGGVDFVNGTNTTVSFNATGNKISINASHPSITTSADTTTTPAQLAHAGTFTAITGVTRDSNGHVTTLNTATYKLPASGNTDTKVTQNVSSDTSGKKYGLLFSYYETSSTTTTAQTSSRKNTIYAIPKDDKIVAGAYGITSGSYLNSFASASLSANATQTFPATGGTVLNTGTTSYTANTASTDTNAYKIGTIKINGTSTDIYGKFTNTTYSVFSGATASADGAQGLVKKPVAGDNVKFLCGDGTWADVPHSTITTSADTTNTGTLSHGGTFTAITAATRDSNGHVTTLNTKTYTLPAQYSHPTYTSKTSGMYKITVDGTGHVSAATAIAASDIKGLSGIDMTGANGTNAGTHGMVPAPAKADNTKYLRGDGTWATPTNTDTKVNVTLATTTKAYLLGTSTTPTSTAAAVTALADTGVYLDTTAGKLTATTFAGQLSGTISSGTTATTQTTGDSSTKVATTAFVHMDALCTNDTLTINCV